jgi:hypothetical protein
MKTLILLTLLFTQTIFAQSFNTAKPGDGTLPVLRSIRVRFVDGDLFKLPQQRNIVINQKLVPGNAIKKSAHFGDLVQHFTISTNHNQMTKVDVRSQLENVLVGSKMITAGELEALNEIFSKQGKIVQEIELNLK